MSYLSDLRVAAKNVNSKDQIAAVHSHVATLTRGYLRESRFKTIIDSCVAKLHADFLNGFAPKIPEIRIVDALNKMAEQFGLPEYAKTSSLEFRLFRLSILWNIPELNPYAMTNPNEFDTSTGKPIQSAPADMSPAEVAYLVCSLVLQKKVNPQFQLTKSETEKQFADYQRSLQHKMPGSAVRPNDEGKREISNPVVNATRFEAVNTALRKDFGK